jgi:hypothetical protein
MIKKISVVLISVLILYFSGNISLKAQPLLDFESGIVFSGYNDVGIPGDIGTRFSLSGDLNAKPAFYYRIKGGYKLGGRHNLFILFAPLTVKSNGIVPGDITFEGVTFPANTFIQGTYKFNSYRLTYRYDLIERPSFRFGLGFTAKIRDAMIELSSSGQNSKKTNVGFVPILNFLVAWEANGKLSFVLDGDALAAPQGRAEDILLSAQYRLSDKTRLKAGYRILEGGADNDEVYNFALFNYAAAGIIINL